MLIQEVEGVELLGPECEAADPLQPWGATPQRTELRERERAWTRETSS